MGPEGAKARLHAPAPSLAWPALRGSALTRHVCARPQATGYAMAYSGLLSIICDLLLLPALQRNRKLPELVTAVGGALIGGVGLVGMSVAGSARGFAAWMSVQSLGTSAFKSAANTLIANAARRDKAGLVSGGADALEAVCRVIAPIGGGALIEAFGAEAPATAAAAMCALGALALHESAPENGKGPDGHPKEKRA